MSSRVSDQISRKTVSGKHPEDDAIPWSQQVDEASYENLSSSLDKKYADPVKYYKAFNCNDSKRNKESCDGKNTNTPYFPNSAKKDIMQGMSSIETPKVVHGDGSEMRNEYHKTIKYSHSDNSSVSNDYSFNKKKITWASIASQPAKPNNKNNSISLKKKGPGMPPPPMIPGKHNLDANVWDVTTNSPDPCESIPISTPMGECANTVEGVLSSKYCKPLTDQAFLNRKQANFNSSRTIKYSKGNNRPVDIPRDSRIGYKQIENHTRSNYKEVAHTTQSSKKSSEDTNLLVDPEPKQHGSMDLSRTVLKKLKDKNNYNPPEINMQKAALSRFFVIKSYSEDDIHRSIKYEIWCSTDHGNKRLDEAFKERVKTGGNVMLFFSVNGSGHFCGMAQMMTSVDYNSTSTVWSQDKWKGKFKVKWIYVKDVPNSQLRHIRLENNDNKSVTNSRDTQEVPIEKGLQVLRILHLYKHQTSIFDDFYHYEKKQEEAVSRKPIQFDDYDHPSTSYNINQQNPDKFPSDFRDTTTSVYRSSIGNRQYEKAVDIKPCTFEHKICEDHPNKDNEDNEVHVYNPPNKNINLENCNNNNSKRNFKNILLSMNNCNCNESNNVIEKKWDDLS